MKPPPRQRRELHRSREDRKEARTLQGRGGHEQRLARKGRPDPGSAQTGHTLWTQKFSPLRNHRHVHKA